MVSKYYIKQALEGIGEHRQTVPPILEIDTYRSLSAKRWSRLGSKRRTSNSGAASLSSSVPESACTERGEGAWDELHKKELDWLSAELAVMSAPLFGGASVTRTPSERPEMRCLVE
jgi:hypothetical protein